MTEHDWTAIVRTSLGPLRVAPEREREIVEELALQLDGAYREAVARGLSPADARAAAAAPFADWRALGAEIERAELALPARASAAMLDADRRGGWLIQLARDLRHSARLARRAPVFTATVVLTLAFGIAATTTVFSVLNGVVLRPLPYHEPDRLVAFWDTSPARGLERERISPVSFMDYRKLSHVFEDAAGWWHPDLTLTDDGLEPIRVNAIEASSNLFDLLGVQPVVGAGFPKAPFMASRPEIVISHRLWRSRYRGDPAIVGRQIRSGGEPFTVLGVMPPGFNFPGDTDVWQRLAWDFTQHTRGAHFLDAVGRLAPGVGLEQAQREVTALSRRLGREYPSTNDGWEMRIGPLDRDVVGSYRVALFALFGAVAALLLIACLNVASLLLVRGVARARELAVRLALGATTARIAAQLLVETLALGCTSVVVGLAMTVAFIRAIVHAAPVEIPRLAEVGMDARVFLFAALLSVGAALAFGLGPALIASRISPERVLRDESRGAGHGRRAAWFRQAVVTAEIALAIVLLTGAGLLLRSVYNMVREDPGFSRTSAIAVTLTLTTQSCPAFADVARFYGNLTSALEARPRIVAAGTTNFLPLTEGWRMPFAVVGRSQPPRTDLAQPLYQSVSEHYFDAIGVPLLKGRRFSDRDSADRPGVALVNAAFRRQYFPSEEPLGRKLEIRSRHIGPLGTALIEVLEYEIVGVVGDVKNTSLQERADPVIYTAMRQFPFRTMSLVVSGRASTEDLIAVVRQEVRRLDPLLPLSDVKTLEGLVASRYERPRLLTWLMGTFAAIALGLAGFGIYGLLAYAVGLRRREICVRRALGAQRRDLVRLVAAESVGIVVAGTGVGLVVSLLATRGLGDYLFNVKPSDPLTLLFVGATLVAVTIVASVAPTLYALRIDPVEGLKDA